MDHTLELGALLSELTRVSTGWTVFKSVGISAQDWAVAKLAVERSDGKEVPNFSLK